MERNTAAEKLWTGKFFLLILINFGNGMAGYMTVPLVTKYAMSIGADITTASSVSSVLSLVAMFMCPVAGVLSDRINRKKLLLVTEIAYSICLFSHVFVANLVMLFVMRAITGIFLPYPVYLQWLMPVIIFHTIKWEKAWGILVW